MFAPLWGRLSDRYGRRGILAVGLAGFASSMLVFSFVDSIAGVYAVRFLSGTFAAAVTPVASATIGDLAANDESRARRLTLISVAGIGGFLVGPMLGLFLNRMGADIVLPFGTSGPLAFPLVATALLALFVAAAIGFVIPGGSHRTASSAAVRTAVHLDRGMMFKLLLLAFIISTGVGAFEVGLALRGEQDLGLSNRQIALMFTECSLVMIVVQAIVFSPLVKPASTRWFITPALSIMSLGLFLIPRASSFALMLAVIGAVAASAGVVLPILTYWISNKSGKAQGAELGKQTSAAALGSAIGSAAGGLLFDVPFRGASFTFVAVLTVIGAAASLGLPRLLLPRTTAGMDERVVRTAVPRARPAGHSPMRRLIK